MAINLVIHDHDLIKDKSNIHFIPAKSSDNSDANVEKYFNSYTEETANGDVLLNSFRGYPLKGNKFQVPAKCKGLIFQEQDEYDVEDKERNFRVTDVFDEFTYWNYDKIPSKNDALQQAVQWIDLSNVIQKPISIEEFNSVYGKSIQNGKSN